MDVEHGDGLIRAAQEHTRHFHSPALIKLADYPKQTDGFSVTFQPDISKQVMATSATHLWLSKLKHDKSFGGGNTGGV